MASAKISLFLAIFELPIWLSLCLNEEAETYSWRKLTNGGKEIQT